MKKTLSAVMALALGLSLVAGTKAVDVDTLLGLKTSGKTEVKYQIDIKKVNEELKKLEEEFKVLAEDVNRKQKLVELYCAEEKAVKVLTKKLERWEAAEKFVKDPENKKLLASGADFEVKTLLNEHINKLDKNTKKSLDEKVEVLKALKEKYEAESAKDASYPTKVAKEETVRVLTALGLYTKKTETKNHEVLENAKKALEKEIAELNDPTKEYQMSLASIETLAAENHESLQVAYLFAKKKLEKLGELVVKHDLDPKLFDKSCPAPGRLINHPAGEKETKETTEKKAKKDNVPNTASAAAAASLAFATIFAAAAAVVAKRK